MAKLCVVSMEQSMNYPDRMSWHRRYLSRWITGLVEVELQSRRDQLQDKWTRDLPTNEHFSDRWKRAERLDFGKGTSIYDSALVFGDVSVGSNTWIGPFTILDGSGAKLTIGNNCSISAGVQIYTHDTVRWAVSGGSGPYDFGETTVGDNCYVGPGTIIAKGVTIGSHCIIGANSTVLHDIPAGARAFGSPCRVHTAQLHEDSTQERLKNKQRPN